jgi:predicted transcriptional regulator
MEVHLNPELEARLTLAAVARGSQAEDIAREAIEHFLQYDEWFVREVEKGIASADAGNLLTHDEVGRRLEKRLAEKQTSR